MKIGTDNTFGYSTSWWTNDELLNEQSLPESIGNAKYDAFVSIPFTKVRMCIGAPNDNCVEHQFAKQYQSAKELFSAGYINDPQVDRAGILKAFDVTRPTQDHCPMQKPGFNVQCAQDNWVRWGFCLNMAEQPCVADDGDSDGTIGIGLKGQSTPNEMGAGWTALFVSPCENSGHQCQESKNAWFYVHQA